MTTPVTAPPLSVLVPLFFAVASGACRSEPERSAMAQAPSGAQVSSAERAVAQSGLPGVTVRRLSTSDYRTFEFSSISPDGRYLSMIDWSTIDLAVRDLRTGELHRLTNAPHERAEGGPYQDAGSSIFSPDGRRMLYVWQRAPGYQLRIMEFEPDRTGTPHAAESTTIFDQPRFEPYFPFDWSPDGDRIVANVWLVEGPHHDHSVNQLAFISTVDGSYRTLKSFDWRWPLQAAFSPDGRYVAYDFPPELESADRDVFVVSVEGTHEARIVDGPAIDRLLGWHPDGSILFHSERGGTPGVWRLPMEDGRPAGSPELLKADMWSVEPLGIAEGRFYYGVNANPPRLYTAPVDLETGRLTGAPLTVADPARTEVQSWDWSADGDFLAYSATVRGTSGSVIGIRSAAGEDVPSLRVDLEEVGPIHWHPDGRSIVAFATDSKGRQGFFRIVLESRAVSAILPMDELENRSPSGHFALSPDGGTLYFAVTSPERPSDSHLRLVSYELSSGEMRSLGWVLWPGRVVIAPDGTELAVVSPETGNVGTLPVTGGPVSDRFEPPEGAYVSGLEWTPEGRFILVSTVRAGGEDLEDPDLWTVPAGGGQARRIELVEHLDSRPARLHPDGRRIAFMAGESRGEVWVMEGLGETGTVPMETEDSR